MRSAKSKTPVAGWVGRVIGDMHVQESKSSLLRTDKGNLLSGDIPPELAANLATYRTDNAVARFSIYRLYPEEEYLFPKYYRPGESVLDLACGMGRTTLMLHEMGLRVRGIDRSEVFVEIAQRRFPYLDFRIGSYDCIDESDSSFSHILISINGIDCAFPEAQRCAAFRECARVLKPGGTFIFSSHNLKSMHWFSPYYRGRLRWKFRNCLKAFKRKAYILEDGEYLFYSTPEYVVRQAEEVGLKLLEMKEFTRIGVNRLDRYLSPYLHYVFTKSHN